MSRVFVIAVAMCPMGAIVDGIRHVAHWTGGPAFATAQIALVVIQLLALAVMVAKP